VAASENLEFAGFQFQYNGARDSRFLARGRPKDHVAELRQDVISEADTCRRTILEACLPRKESRIARTVVLKLKTSEFKILTRSHTAGSPPASCEELTNIALSLLQRVGLRPHQRFRLVGVGLSNFCDPEDGPAQTPLFT